MKEVVQFKPIVTVDNLYVLGKEGTGYIIYNDSKENAIVDLSKENLEFNVYWINPKDGKILKKEIILTGKTVEFINLYSEPFVIWITKN